MGLGLGCCMAFLRLGFSCSLFAAVSFSLAVGSLSVFVLIVPRGGFFVFLNVGSRLVLVF